MSNDNTLDSLFFNKLSYREIYTLKDQGNLKYDYVIKREKSFVIKDEEENIYTFFLNPTSVNFQNVFINNKRQNREINNIYSSIQIEEYFRSLNISNPFVISKENKKIFSLSKINIDPFIQDNKLTIYNDVSSFNEFETDEDISLIESNKFKPKELSRFFFEYFAYNKKNSEKLFEYDYTKNRESFISSYLDVLVCDKSIKYFKFTGPSSTGKSTTLLKYSRQHEMIIYLNLKSINTLEKENNFDHYNLIIYEFRKLSFESLDIKTNFKNMLINECQNKPSGIIILNILKFIKTKNYIIILDQFKKKYLGKTNFEDIEKLIKESKLKLILCSSINDKEIRDEVIKTIEKFGGNPGSLNSYSQDYYFYFYKTLFKKRICENNPDLNKLLELFDYRPKYQFLFYESKSYFSTKNEIKTHITEKIKEFFAYEQDLDLCKVFLNIKNKIKEKFNYSSFSNIIEKVPLKYYILKLEKNYFEIDYAFEFIQYIEKDNITQEECMKYFLNQKYELDKSLDGHVKGEYFEMCAKFFMEFNNVLPVAIDNKILVKNIVGMKMIKNEKNDLDKILYYSEKKISREEIKPKKKDSEEIELAANLLKKDNVDSKEMLDEKYKNKKNIDYYLMNYSLNYLVPLKKEKKDDSISVEKKKLSLLNNKRIREKTKDPGVTQTKKDLPYKIKIKKEEEKKKLATNIKSKNEQIKKEKARKEQANKKEREKEMINEIVSKNLVIKIKKMKTAFKKEEDLKEDINYINDIGDRSILINQEDSNGKTLDQAFIYGKKDKKIFLGLQMKCLSNKVEHSTTLKNIYKENIKQNCQSILFRCKSDLNVQIKEWHYIIIAYYNNKEKEKDNVYCKQLLRHCKQKDLEIYFFNPEEQKIYNNKFVEVEKIQISNESNLDYDFPESNPYNIIYNEMTNDLIDSYYNERNNKFTTKYYLNQKSMDNLFVDWIKEINLKKINVENDLKILCESEKLKLIDRIELKKNFMIPSPCKRYLFLFKNRNRNNLVCFYHKDKLKIKDFENDKNIEIIKLSIYIDIEEEYFFVYKF